ncbi:NitT/TauT family transport system ATP-binding protein [Prauserella aidingensis]|uniref:ABC transporter ATP-binding protein n=1 Tax=Prauserella aidingensis TaxID=387890 RepID=UPI0020A39E9C|nr:ABC transporter ATP-binding protein [Prauserella aidingensis]MCP2253761.1 NitT/TauT family transport system ATP-binding protein [Prauserella aidingensis]
MSDEPTFASALVDDPPQPMIGCRGVSKTFPGAGRDFVALDGVDLDIAPDEFITVLGPSGCGKSTLLNLIAGFDLPTAGTVSVAGGPVTGPSPDKGVVFQDFALFPWLTVRKNIAYGLREKRLPKAEIRRIVDDMLDTVGLERVADHYPHQLSGGMKQRVSIARVLAIDPRILLLDEPFGALDEQRRSGLQDELLRIWEQRRKTAVFVTHSVEEAIVLGDRVVVMAAGPGRITAVVDVDLARPRDRTSDEFNALRREVTAHLWS